MTGRGDRKGTDMANYHLNHINIRTLDLEKTRDFYADAIGLVEGGRPPRTNPAGMGTGLEHFAMWGEGLSDQLAVLDAKGISYMKRMAGRGAVVQVVFEDPNGIMIELGFNPEAEGVTKADFPDNNDG